MRIHHREPDEFWRLRLGLRAKIVDQYPAIRAVVVGRERVVEKRLDGQKSIY